LLDRQNDAVETKFEEVFHMQSFFNMCRITTSI